MQSNNIRLADLFVFPALSQIWAPLAILCVDKSRKAFPTKVGDCQGVTSTHFGSIFWILRCSFWELSNAVDVCSSGWSGGGIAEYPLLWWGWATSTLCLCLQLCILRHSASFFCSLLTRTSLLQRANLTHSGSNDSKWTRTFLLTSYWRDSSPENHKILSFTYPCVLNLYDFLFFLPAVIMNEVFDTATVATFT